MKKSKKRIITVISVLLTLCIGFSSSALALQENFDALAQPIGRYILSDPAPSDIVDYASEHAAGALTDYLLAKYNGVVTEDMLYQHQLGTPYTISADPDQMVCSFPIILENTIVYTMEIMRIPKEDGTYSYSYQLSSAEEEMSLLSSNPLMPTQIVYYTNDNAEKYILTSDREYRSVKTQMSAKSLSAWRVKSTGTAINVMTPVPYAQNADITTRAGDFYVIYPSFREIQSQSSIWCLGFTTAEAIYKSKGILATSTLIANWTGNNWGIIPTNTGIPEDKAVDYANSKGCYVIKGPVSPRNNIVSSLNNILQDELEYYQKFSIIGITHEEGSSITHSALYCGYTANSYYIWDPYRSDVSIVSRDDDYGFFYTPRYGQQSHYPYRIIHNF